MMSDSGRIAVLGCLNPAIEQLESLRGRQYWPDARHLGSATRAVERIVRTHLRGVVTLWMSANYSVEFSREFAASVDALVGEMRTSEEKAREVYALAFPPDERTPLGGGKHESRAFWIDWRQWRATTPQGAAPRDPFGRPREAYFLVGDAMAQLVSLLHNAVRVIGGSLPRPGGGGSAAGNDESRPASPPEPSDEAVESDKAVEPEPAVPVVTRAQMAKVVGVGRRTLERDKWRTCLPAPLIPSRGSLPAKWAVTPELAEAIAERSKKTAETILAKLTRLASVD